MKLEFIDNINEYGDQSLRLFEFEKTEAVKFRDAIQQTIIEQGNPLDLNSLDFIESTNCRLILHLSDEDAGIMTQDNILFFCDLTLEGYKNIIHLIEPYCIKNTRSFQLLYDLDTEIDFEFSPYGTTAKE